MKIKKEKLFQIDGLLRYIWDNSIRDAKYTSVNDEASIIVTEAGFIKFDDEWMFDQGDIFKVEVEEEITGDTVLPYIIHVFRNKMGEVEVVGAHHTTINKLKIPVEVDAQSLAMMIVNDVDDVQTIWKVGDKMIDGDKLTLKEHEEFQKIMRDAEAYHRMKQMIVDKIKELEYEGKHGAGIYFPYTEFLYNVLEEGEGL